MLALTHTRIDLNRAQPPADTGIPNVAPRRPVDDSAPREAEIASAARRLRRNKAPGITKTTSNHLKAWMKQALEPEVGKDPQRQLWDTLVQLIQHMWSTGQLPTELTWSIQVLLPKSNGGARGIELLEVARKLMESIIDTRVKEVIEFHDCLHGFRSGRGTDISIVEAKLIQQMAAIAGEALFECFIDLRQAFDSVDHEEGLTMLEDRGAGPNLLRLLHNFWEQQEIACRQGGFHGPSFRAGRGATQGRLFSPSFFNIIIDQVVRYWLQFTITEDHDTATNGLRGATVRDLMVAFYADDGLFAVWNHQWLQDALNVLVTLFQKVGLETNVDKTKILICHPSFVRTHLRHLSDEAYKRRLTGEGLSYRDRKQQRMQCQLCIKPFAASYIDSHRATAHHDFEYALPALPEALLEDAHVPHSYNIS